MTAELHATLSSCFSPAEFCVEVLAQDARILPRLPAHEAAIPAAWFFAAMEALRRDGLLDDPALWTRMQRVRARRCRELHVHRRRHVLRAHEAPPPTRGELERVVATIADSWDSRPAVAGLANDLGIRAAVPSAGRPAALAYWLLQTVVCAADSAALFQLAARLRARAMDDPALAAGAVERLAIAVCDGEAPPVLLAAWLAIEPDRDECMVSWRSFDPPAARDMVVPLDASTATVELGGGMRVELTRDGCAMELAIRASGKVPWLGTAVRLCHGARSVVRTMLGVLGDHLGDDAPNTILLEVIALDGMCDDNSDSASRTQ